MMLDVKLNISPERAIYVNIPRSGMMLDVKLNISPERAIYVSIP